LIDGFVASLEDSRPSIVEQALLYHGSLKLFKGIKLPEHKMIADHIVQQLSNPNSNVQTAAIRALVALNAKDQTSAIVKLLANENREVQQAAIEALATLDAKDQVSAIVKFLSNKNPGVRQAAIRVLAALDAKDQASIIVTLLVDKASYVQVSAIEALTELKAEEQTSAIVKLLADEGLDVRITAIRALATLDAKDQVSAIVKLLSNKDPVVRVTAIRALAALDAKDQASAIVTLLSDKKTDVRGAAFEALVTLNAKVQASAIVKVLEDRSLYLQAVEAIKMLIALDAKDQASTIVKFLATNQYNLRKAAIEALVAFDAKDQVSAIVTLLSNKDSGVQIAAIEALAALNAKGQASTIVKLLADKEYRVRQAAIKALDALNAKDQASAIITLLSNKDPDIRITGIEALAALNAKDQASAIVKLLTDKEYRIRQAAIKALTELKAKKQTSAIVTLLSNEDPDVRITAIRALAALDAKDQANTIVKFLADKEYHIRQASIRALESLDAKDQASTIIKLLPNKDSGIREAVIDALTALNAKDQAGAIVKFLMDKEPDVQAAAIRALVSLDAKDQVGAIVTLLSNEDPDVRIRAINILVELDAKDQTSAIVKLLADKESDVQVVATRGLVALDAKNKTGATVKLLSNKNPDIRIMAIQMLYRLDAKDQTSAIGKLLADKETNVQIAAIRALVLLDAKDQTSAIVKLLADDKPSIRQDVIRALVALDIIKLFSANVKELSQPDFYIAELFDNLVSQGPFSFDNLVFLQIFKYSYQDPQEFSKFLFLAHLIGGGNEENEIAITFLGALNQPSRIGGNINPEEGNKILNVFNKIWALTEVQSKFREDVTRKSAELVNNVNWKTGDILALVSLENKLREDYPISANTVQRKIDKNEIFKKLTVVGQFLLGHILFWLILITAYPRYPMIQAIFFWNPKVRRIIGLAYVGFFLTWVRPLRTKLFAPFRLSLRADAMLDEFKEDAYFSEYRIKPLPHGESRLISKAFQSINGQTILQGDSGLGKTMLLRALTARSKNIVVFIPALKCTQGVMAAIQKKLQGSAKDGKFLRNLIYAGAIDIYIDGLNEVSPETRAKISGFAEEYFKANIIMTTQPMEWSFPTTARSYEIEALNRDQIEAFLISRKLILAVDAPVSGKDFEASCRSYLTSYFEQSEEMIKVAQKVLSNPMDLTTVAHVLSLGKNPDLFNLQEQSYQIMANDFKHTNIGDVFPLQNFSERVYQMRLEDESVLPVQDYEQEIACLERHKMVLSRQVNNHGEEKQFRFRHDKIMDFFIVQAFLGKDNDKPQKHLGDPRFRGVYFMLATLMPLADAQVLREQLIDFAVDTKDHTVSDSFIEIVRFRKEDSVIAEEEK